MNRHSGNRKRYTSPFPGLVFGLLGWCWLSTTVYAQSLTVQVDRNPIHQNETVQLMVRFEGHANGRSPDFTILEPQFDVLGTTQSTRISMLNGHTTRITEWLATLSPTKTGHLTIPALQIDRSRSAPIQLTVLPGNQDQGSRQRDIFLEVGLSPKEPYVQSQLVYTVRVFHAVPIREGQLSEPHIPDVTIQQLADDVSFDTRRQGRSYRVTERKYAIIPQKSGTLTIPPLAFTGHVIDSSRQQPPMKGRFQNRHRLFGSDPFSAFVTPLKPVRIHSRELTVQVKPIPPQMQGDPWLPSKKFDLSESWSFDISNTHTAIHVGDPLTRTITMKATGVPGERIPDIPLETASEFINVYPDKPTTHTTVEGNTTIGLREQKIAFIPIQAGTITIPEIRIPWWDINEHVRKVAVLPSRSLKVLPPAGHPIHTSPPHHPAQAIPKPSENHAMSRTTSKPEASENGPLGIPDGPRLWQSLAGVFFVAWMATVAGWWRSRSSRFQEPVPSQPRPTPSPAQSRQAVRAACHQQSIHQTKETLLQWAAIQWEQHPPRSLGGLANILTDTQAQEAIRDLDRRLYSDSEEPWDGVKFWKAIEPVLKAPEKSSPRNTASHSLPSLYLTPDGGANLSKQ